MKLRKRIVHSRAVTGFFCWFMALYICLVYATSRKKFIIDSQAQPYVKGEANGIFAFWHGRMMMFPPYYPPKQLIHMLISHHRDGVMIARVIEHFGHRTVAGSSSRGGEAALRGILRILKHGDNIGITPDGPRGPFQIVAPGIITIARLAQKPIIPVAFSASRCKRLKSWDRFMLALPFSRLVFCVGTPIMIDKHLDEAATEKARQHIESAMNQLTQKADERAHV